LRCIKSFAIGTYGKVPVTPFTGDCGDYSTVAINYNNLNFIGLGMRLGGKPDRG
jgi:hypothetical protein